MREHVAKEAEGAAKEFIEKLDTNKDGYISLEEMVESVCRANKVE